MSDAALPSRPMNRILGGPAIKLGLIGVLLLALQIPTVWVSGLIEERQDRQAEVQAEIGRSWGPAQDVRGPIMVVPFRANEPQPRLPTGQPQLPLPVRGFVHVLPNRLSADVKLTPERRKRGLFAAVVYNSTVALSGSFNVPSINVPSLSGTPYENAELLWNEAFIVAGSTDLRSSDPDTQLTADNRRLDPAEDAPTPNQCGQLSVMRWNLGLDSSPVGRPVPFSMALTLRGTGSFNMVPAARRMEMTVSAPWATPSFRGVVLPTRSTVTDAAFEAEWRDIGGVQQTVWLSREAMNCTNAGSLINQQVGVDLLEAVPTYRMVNRASKYAALFMALAFLTYFLFETVTRRSIHIVQYGMLGLSLSLFALLLLAVAEPVGFAPAYGVATAMVLAQASLYTLLVTRRAKLAGTFAGVLTLLFGFLYTVLNLESYSLLVGAVALFAVLSVVMVITSRLDWSAKA